MSVLNNVDLEQVKQKLYEDLKSSGWADQLKTFILSADFDKILKYLLKEAQEGRRFTPVLKQVFRAFKECPFDQLKVVVIGQDPYPQPLTADGIAFSCSNKGKIEASLKYIFMEVEDTVYKGSGYVKDPDLKRWSNQGVLLLNTAFTTRIGYIGSHYEIWKPFMVFLMDRLNHKKSGLIYTFMGKKAQEWIDYIPENSKLLTCSHPASAAYNKDDKWDSGDVFNKINHYCKESFNTEIIW